MLLGIVLHAAIPFVPYWEEGDAGGGFLYALFEYIHLWRMPLFFLLSGFFTAMLWRRRGLRALVRFAFAGSLRRSIFYVPVIVLVLAGIVGGYVIAGVDAEDTARPMRMKPRKTTTRKVTVGGGRRLRLCASVVLVASLWLVAAFAFLAAHEVDRPGRPGPPAAPLGYSCHCRYFRSWGCRKTCSGPMRPTVSCSHRRSSGLRGVSSSAQLNTAPAIVETRSTDSAGGGRQLVGSLIVFGVLVGEVLDTGSVVLEVTAAWMVSFGMVGAFRERLAQPSFRVRWLSDSSYWMYRCISRWCSCSRAWRWRSDSRRSLPSSPSSSPQSASRRRATISRALHGDRSAAQRATVPGR